MAEIRVRGQAEARLAPTSAGLTIVVKVSGAQGQSDAVDVAATRCEAVDAAVAEHRAGLIDSAVDYSLRTGQEWDYSGGKGRRLVGYYATRTTELDCQPDGERLTTFLRVVSGMKQVQINGPRWHIAPDAPGYDELRRDAAADARRKATAYGVGLGVTVGRVAWVAEVGLRDSATREPGEMMMAAAAPMARAMRGNGGGEEDEPTLVRVRPEPIRVTATVEVGFDLIDD